LFFTLLFFNSNAFSQAGQKFSVSGNTLSPGDYIGTNNLQPLIIKTNSTEWLRVAETGNVGIGTSAPADKLHVAGTARMLDATVDNLIQALSVSAQSANFATAVVTGQFTAGSLIVNGNATVSGQLTASTLAAQTILQNGNPVQSSQWTTAPDGKSISYSTGDVLVQNLGVAGVVSIGAFRFSNGGINPLPATIDSISTPFAMSLSSKQKINLDADKVAVGTLASFDRTSTQLTVTGNIQASGNLRLSSLAGTGNRQVFVDANGNISGGDQVPVPTCPGALPQWDMVGASNDIYNCLGGRVGIGTTSPKLDLSVGSGDSNFGLQKSDASPNAGYLRFGDNTGWKFHIGRTKESFTSSVNTNTTGVLMTVMDNGKVGIGTTNPTSTLHLEGEKPEIRLQNNTSADNEDVNFVISSANGAGRLITDKSLSIFINGDNDQTNQWFSVIHNTESFSGGPITLFQVNEDGDATLCGTFQAKKIKVTATAGCDFVFAADYNKMTWHEKELYYKKHKRLPYMESAITMESDGLDVGANFSGLLQNIEEDRLDMTELFIRMEKVEKQNENLKKETKPLCTESA